MDEYSVKLFFKMRVHQQDIQLRSDTFDQLIERYMVLASTLGIDEMIKRKKVISVIQRPGKTEYDDEHTVLNIIFINYAHQIREKINMLKKNKESQLELKYLASLIQ